MFDARNKLFIKFPGRDLGGALAFLKGFRTDTWLACGLYVFILPAFLALAHAVLERALLHYGLYGLDEDNSWGFGWNLLVFLAALAQQVVSSTSAMNTTCTMHRDKTQLLCTSARGLCSFSCSWPVWCCLKASGGSHTIL